MQCKAKVLAVAVRAKRAEQRQKLGALVTLRIAPTTRNRYALAYERFSTFIAMMGVVLRSLSDIDMAAAWYIEHLWQEGEPKPWGADTIAALQYYIPHVKRNMVLCWSMLKAWDRLEMPCRALPFTPMMLLAFGGALCRMGYRRLALMAVLTFDVLARTGEMLSLTAGQMHIGTHQAVIAFTHTKRGQRIGIDESVVVRDATILKVARHLARNRLPGDRVLGMTERELRKIWAAATAILGLQEFACRPYSLRRGGATALFRETGSLHDVAERGRWASLTTTRRYIDDGVAALAGLLLTDFQERNFAALAAEFKSYINDLAVI